MHRIVPMTLTLAGPPGGLAYFDPVGRLIAGAAESVLLHEGLQQMKAMAVTSLPVPIDPSGDLGKEMTGQVWHDHGRQDEKSAVVGDERQALGPLLGRPTDPPITRGALPGGGPKKQARQIRARATAN